MKGLHWVVVASAALLAALLWVASRPPDAATEAAAATTQAPADEFAIRDVRVFDGERVLERATVHVRDGRIVALGEALALPDGIQSVPGAGRTLLPGFIDAHVHTWGEARQDALRFGVTAQLDMFSDPAQLPAARRERATLDTTDRADLWSAGMLATAAGGHGTQFGIAVPTLAAPDAAAAWVAARKAEGSDYIKIVRENMHVYGATNALPTLDRATAAALIDAAHAQGLRAVVHVSALADAREAIEDGADGLVHLFHDAPADGAFVTLARERGVFVVPTLAVIAGFSGRATTLPDDPRVLPWLSAEQRGTLAARFPAPPEPAHLLAALESVQRLHVAGVPLLAGTDAPNPNTAHGASMHEELVLLVDGGLAPRDALAAATARAADAFGLDDRGRIAPGKRADLVLVEGNPTADITATRAIAAIWKNGRAVQRNRAVAVADGAALDVLAPGLVSDFDTGGLDARIGSWSATSDRMAGGASDATVAALPDGAAGAGALRTQGRIEPGFAYPWAGAFLAVGAAPMQPVDASALTELVFQARGDGRAYAVLLFSGQQPRPIPARVQFTPGTEWREVRVVFADVADVDLATLRGIAFTAHDPAGAFTLDLDRVELR
ncbi:CIA30 family protein [Chiayiivirga flava]|uniref:Imidazolonepropionase-like amidohydrolase n=1 Tax=Chiayiivirga flava TaxID=659595 RepID=A0A7W8G361_9GAMM|nr:CIA30 family protein [Chiayiivirga flava]MBB5209420.1 imidazolonepropionase-like amidohydrolase [Chiayiivirga flava]